MTDRYYGGLLFFRGTCMKLTEADYYAKNGALFKKNDVGFSGIKKLVLTENTLSGSLFDGFSPDTLILLEFPVTFACCDSETFDEAFLADLRSVLKQLEETGKTVVFSVTGKIVGADDSAVFYHIARRIKDCKSVAGICFQAGTTKGTAMSVIDALQKKHPEYVYFASESGLYDALDKDYTARIAFAGI